MSGKAPRTVRSKKSKKVSKSQKKVVEDANGASSKRKERRKKPKRTFSRYIMKALNSHNLLSVQQTPITMRVSKKAMSILHAMCVSLLERITTQASQLCQNAKKKTISTRDVETAVKMHLEPNTDLSRNALNHYVKSATKLSEAMKVYEQAQ
jgi:histone H2B